MARKSKAKPFLTLDCETDPFKAGRVPQPFLWGIYDGESGEYWEFNTAKEVVEFLSRRKIVVYAHNGGKFDYHYLRDDLNSDEPIMVIAGRLARFKIGECEFRDSINILVNPLRAFAKDEIDYSKLEPDVRHLHWEEIRKYLRSDCVNLWNTVHAYHSRFGRTLTQAGASMKYWQKEYKVPFQRQTAAQSKMYREYYFGGRVQCFEKGYGEKKFEVYDANSMYPYAMLFKHPLSPEGQLSTKLPPDNEIHRCLIRLDAIAKGCFPLRSEDNSLYFPHDEKTVREYFVSGWELVAALEMDAVKIINIKQVHYFTQTVDFVDYVTHFYNERKIAKANDDKMGDVFAKLFLNSLYGKFASDPAKYREYVITHRETMAKWCTKTEDHPEPFIDIGPWGERRLLQRPLPADRQLKGYYNVATAASVTGFARAHLFKGLCKSSGVLYCDTDSIAAENASNLDVGKELGQWKKEGSFDLYGIAGKKTYAFRDAVTGKYKTACKGVKLEAEDILRIAKGETVLFNPEVPSYSIHRQAPTYYKEEGTVQTEAFTPRTVKMTAKDIRIFPAQAA